MKADGDLSTYTPDFIVRTTDGEGLDRRNQGPRGTGRAAERWRACGNGAPTPPRPARRGRRLQLPLRLCRSGKLRAAQAAKSFAAPGGELYANIRRAEHGAPRQESLRTDATPRSATSIKLIQQGKPLPEKYRFILFEDKREVELVWNGKTREVCTTVLPFQTLEHIDEPREGNARRQEDLFDSRGRQVKGWTNKLIWGDNKLILSSLKAGALRRQIEDAGGLKLIYIDPPFDVGADFSMDIEIGGETFHKEPNLLEQIAYRDTWGRGADSASSP